MLHAAWNKERQLGGHHACTAVQIAFADVYIWHMFGGTREHASLGVADKLSGLQSHNIIVFEHYSVVGLQIAAHVSLIVHRLVY